MLHDLFHELPADTERVEVDIIQWIEARLSGPVVPAAAAPSQPASLGQSAQEVSNTAPQTADAPANAAPIPVAEGANTEPVAQPQPAQGIQLENTQQGTTSDV